MHNYLPKPDADGTTFAQWFLLHYGTRDAAHRESAIRAAVVQGYGRWISPARADISAQPTTQQHEITVLEVTAVGATAAEAVRNWFAMADVVLNPPPTPTPSAATQDTARRFALVEIVSRIVTQQVAA